ncbi:MAG: hypothetical protein UU73_C0001G0277 [Candidatus Daviesbacteria bacterium GW2011_GWA1_41_61]|uniref:Rossmann fold nucleotide-binding protein n=1 Tax=Candidatus Daviesbacteria bacterium GW2011_GWA2_40_9 TaxID=1618424 RepID=A0A0G0U355_9BACT|nr:MAG: hypothetical protein UU26_C0013G0014 [Candidatus Daviesbacteria bacterium GW2011_GWC1_40_9]KKR83528.1 MAG: hypothetical protein UU29_C0004G0029 [Candidatus Daviesbacteria bacterium GW2011_GWA2_40_9]KKR93096.1 MAG: hypothetical protein UU44_C0004G0278 [Candidatus Daviesbacteria bacterium GW2011_GWB1_41_15]KKS15640.1 MAG: hypothetical protein UU73_C0001G0277 [Candidatus Daviesbacteria bacterium GW2011_GWA1_41_61]
METLLRIWKKLGKPQPPPKARAIEKVTVFGFADAKPADKVYKDAYKVCQSLAEAGYTVVDGGGPGVMEAATLGAKAGGGKVIGVTFYPKDADHFEGRDVSNPIDEEIKTTTYIERTLTLLKEGQVYIVFNGASGTMSEFGMAWGLARIYFGHHKPLILYGDFWQKIMRTLKANLLLRPEELEVFKIATTPYQVLKAITEFEDEVEADRHKAMKVSSEDGFAIQ